MGDNRARSCSMMRWWNRRDWGSWHQGRMEIAGCNSLTKAAISTTNFEDHSSFQACLGWLGHPKCETSRKATKRKSPSIHHLPFCPGGSPFNNIEVMHSTPLPLKYTSSF